MEHANGIPYCEPERSCLPQDAEGSFYPSSPDNNDHDDGVGHLQMKDADESARSIHNGLNDDGDGDDDDEVWIASEERIEKPSNEKLLSTAFISFMTFTLCQTVAAVIAGSEAMMGDSAAMFVDALTYLFNLVAERKKNHFDESYNQKQEMVASDPERTKRIRQRAKRKLILTMELIPPLFSVTILIVVTAFVLHKAIRILILDVHRDRSKQGDPNINLMLAFAVINLALDVVNVLCFAKAKHLFGFETIDGQHGRALPTIGGGGESYDVLDGHDMDLHNESRSTGSQRKDNGGGSRRYSQQNSKTNGVRGNGHHSGRQLVDPPGRKEDTVAMTTHHAHASSTGSILDNSLSSEEDDDEREGANLNMCSAYTHVFADTLRSIAVIVASLIAKLVDGVTPEEADATAAVVVSFLILLSLLPLFNGLKQTYSELRAIRAEESSEVMFPYARATVELV